MRQGLAALVLALLLPGAAAAQSTGYCAPGATYDTLRPLPAALVPRLRQVFGLPRLPAEVAVQSSFIRCDGGRLLACTIGANLPCDKADTRRRIPAADAFCREGGRGDVPAYATGHATLYAWACRGGRAEPMRQVAHADARGFVAEYWKPLD